MDLSRQIALDILIAWDRNGGYPNILLRDRLERLSNQRDRSFCTELVYGTIENKLKLDYFISQVSSVPLRKIHFVNRNILRMGLYQGFYMNVPISAACNTSVELAKKNGQYRSHGFINAVLRKLLTNPVPSLPTDNAFDSISIRFSVDQTIVKLLDSSYSDGFAEEYLSALEKLDPDVTHVAINTLKTDADTLAARFLQENVAVLNKNEQMLEVRFSSNLSTLSTYKEGLFHVIGQPSMLTVNNLEARPYQTVYDLCSAPGGKTFALAYQMKNTGKIIAMDIHPHKIDAMEIEAKRLGITNIDFVCADATNLNERWRNSADRVLCDVPCSGLGIIRKKPDIRYKNMDNFSLGATQRAILQNGELYLKSGGKLVYSTCTVNPAENENVAHASKLVLQNEKLFLPQSDLTEGFYYALLQKD